MSWQDRCVAIMDFLKTFNPEVDYNITFKKHKDEWQFSLNVLRNDKGQHSGSPLWYVSVTSKDVEVLPDLLLDKVKQKLIEWQQDGMNKVIEQQKELQKAREELDKRMNVKPKDL